MSASSDLAVVVMSASSDLAVVVMSASSDPAAGVAGEGDAGRAAS